MGNALKSASCMETQDSPNVVLKVRATCCNKVIKIHIDDTERIKALLDYVHKLSERELNQV